MLSRFANHGVVGGQNVSPALSWEDVPVGTASFALTVVDIHPIANDWVHWLIVNLSAETRALEENCSRKKIPAGAKELFNSFGTQGYGGPQPPKGSGPHQYVTSVYALDLLSLDLSANASLAAFKKAIENHVLASSSIVGLFER